MFLVFILIHGASSGGRLLSSGFLAGSRCLQVVTCTLKFSVVCSAFTTFLSLAWALMRGLSCCAGVAGTKSLSGASRSRAGTGAWFYKLVYV